MTKDLTGIELDYEVAKAAGLEVEIIRVENETTRFAYVHHTTILGGNLITVDWKIIGPIIAKMDIWTTEEFTTKERFMPDISYPATCRIEPYVDDDGCVEYEFQAEGADVLEAIKRCLVKRARAK